MTQKMEVELAGEVVTTLQPSKALGGLAHVNEFFEFSKKISGTEMVPSAMRGKPDMVLAAFMAGYELGIAPMHALQSINIIKGRPSISAELMRALVLESGHSIIVDATDAKATATCKRRDWSEAITVTFTFKDAERALLVTNDNWKKYPRAMLAARVTSEACRLHFPDVISGLSYTPEEIEDFSGPSTTPTPVHPAGSGTPLRVVQDEGDDLFQDTEPLASEDSKLQIKDLLIQLGYTDAADRGKYVAEFIGHSLVSMNDLTLLEANNVVNHLELILQSPTDASTELGAVGEEPF